MKMFQSSAMAERIPSASRPLVQMKAFIGAVNDPLEREADRVADAVVSDGPVGSMSTAWPTLQRSGGEGSVRGTAAEPASRALAQAGDLPLTPTQRAYFEPRFGASLSHVRLHKSDAAADAARRISARAFTLGSHIGFAEGERDTSSHVGRRLLAHELAHVIQQTGSRANIAGNEMVQRQPDPQAEIEMPAEYAFALDPRKRTDRRYALKLAREDAARIRKAGSLSPNEREEVNAKLRFFEGDAYDVYSQAIKPVLIMATQEEIEMPGDEPAATAAKPQAGPGSAFGKNIDFFKRMRDHPQYIDNDIKEVNYYTAELAVIHYKDGLTFKLGLVPKWMEPPVVEVDYHTPDYKIRMIDDQKRGFGFFLEPELETAPRTMPYSELISTYGHFVEFYAHGESGRIVPSRINMLTAPTLCAVLLDSEHRYVGTTEMISEMGVKVTAIIGAYAGAGGWTKGPPTVATRTPTTVMAMSASARKVATEMDGLLASGGTRSFTVEGMTFKDVEVATQGSRLMVRRFESNVAPALRGQGVGSRVNAAFEEAAVSVARRNGLKTVTIDVGTVINPGWREVLESIGYKLIPKEGRWVKTIQL